MENSTLIIHNKTRGMNSYKGSFLITEQVQQYYKGECSGWLQITLFHGKVNISTRLKLYVNSQHNVF